MYTLQIKFYAQYAKGHKLGNFCNHEKNKTECPTNEQHEATKIVLT